MADTGSFVFRAFTASSSSFSHGTVDVKAKSCHRTVKVKGRSGCSCAANTNISSATTRLSNPFPSSTPSYTPEKMIESGSSERAENSGKDTKPNQQPTQKENEKVSLMEENSELASCPDLPLIPISRILKGIPQCPHFLQLRSYSEVARKNLMAGWDRAFEETVEEIHSLTAKDFWAEASNLWKSMEDLQGLGYNVFRLRRRLVELTEVMEEQKLSKLEIGRLRSKAESHRMEKCRLESVIFGLQQRTQREHATMVEMLKGVARIENGLPKFDGAFAVLAMEPI
ncbi:hypothetical protein FH972_001349 [Carpinus fangiana]|uniref:Uncharacterized protein n=1 Tax=Carpinus fangiana TaxID=176857 RepID=A0A5N6QEN6_9ROSI|nr:hypothetical protein FH972_001349 [Carpinus fangiana]